METTLLYRAVADISRLPIISNTSVKTIPSFERESPFDVYFMGKASKQVTFKMPLKININNDDGYYIVSDDLFLVYGEGKDQQAAMEDYLLSLVEFYDIVKEESSHDKFEAAQLKLLDLYIDVK